MKKLVLALLVIGVAAFISTSAFAGDSYVEGGFEASGHVNAGLGYQHQNNKVTTEAALGVDGNVSYAGPIGRYFTAPNLPTTRSDHFEFFVDEVELDIAKSFGENIRLRADLDFARLNSSGTGPVFGLEQAYATANIPLGNGVEVLLGRFNMPIGFESVDINDNDTLSESIILRSQIRPVIGTGGKLYYAFSDALDFHFWAVNTITNDTLAKKNDLPGFGFRLGYNWGEEGTESTVGFSGFFGPTSPTSNKHFTFGGDLDLNWWITESFALGLEGIFRRDNSLFPGAVPNMETMAGLLNLKYAFSDVWDGTLKYVFAHQFDNTNGAHNFLGAEGNIHEIALAGGYSVADGAVIKLEGRFDIVNPKGGSNNQYVFGAGLAFCYDF